MKIPKLNKIILLSTALCYSLVLPSQMVAEQDSSSPAVEKLAAHITGNTDGDKEKANAIYSWVAQNIDYDYLGVENVTLGFKSMDVVAEALEKRKGVCQHYAELVHALAVESGLTSIVVFGYTRQNGRIDKVPHAWNALMIDSTWYLFDPTWGSGYVMGKQYRKEYTEKYFMVKPGKMIKSHMPFDPLFQFLEYPVGHDAFKHGRSSDSSLQLDYRKGIQRYLGLDEKSQLAESMERVQQFGIANTMVRGYFSNLNSRYRVHVANRQINLHNQAIELLNEVVNDYNLYVEDMNARDGRLPEDTRQIEATLDRMEARAEEAMSLFSQVDPPMKLAQTLAKNVENLEKLLAQVRKEQNRLKQHKLK